MAAHRIQPKNKQTLHTIRRVNYRKLAFDHYPPVCAHCGFGIGDVLEVAHIDCNRSNNAVSNLIILCPNCHKMHDLDLISTATIIEMRDRPKVVVWAKRMKDAGRKAAESRRVSAEAEKWRLAGLKAAETRVRNLAARQQHAGNTNRVKTVTPNPTMEPTASPVLNQFAHDLVSFSCSHAHSLSRRLILFSLGRDNR